MAGFDEPRALNEPETRAPKTTGKSGGRRTAAVALASMTLAVVATLFSSPRAQGHLVYLHALNLPRIDWSLDPSVPQPAPWTSIFVCKVVGPLFGTCREWIDIHD
jgi:hypothetical protein